MNEEGQEWRRDEKDGVVELLEDIEQRPWESWVNLSHRGQNYLQMLNNCVSNHYAGLVEWRCMLYHCYPGFASAGDAYLQG